MTTEAVKTFIFIDGSYFCFYRYYSIMRWWKSAHADEPPLTDPFLNSVFVEKFKKTFVQNIARLSKDLKVETGSNDTIMIVGKDCKRENIWRNEFYDKYKANRATSAIAVAACVFMGGPFFKMAYEDKLFEEGGVKHTLYHPKLEADDCIAISVKLLSKKHPTSKIFIISSDKDYLQLASQNIKIVNLKGQNIAELKSSNGDAGLDLFCKIVMGDKSDNIPSVLAKCGPKTALKYYHDRACFDEKMKKENAYEKWNKNQLIIDFNYIPQYLIDEFTQSLIYL
jgi:5'-3' exonuclease